MREDKYLKSLDSQSLNLWLIFGSKDKPLTKDFNFYYDRLISWCKINARFYAFIGHDKDLNEDVTPKFRHIHAVIILKNGSKPRLSTSLNRFSEILEIDGDSIDIDGIMNMTQCCRYLIHKGYPLKHQYLLEEVKTSDIDLIKGFVSDEPFLTADYIINLVQICNCSTILILKEIGIKNYLKMRNIIIDLIKELNA